MKLHRLEKIELTPEIFSVFRRQPPLLTAGDRESCNTMTIGWCGLGRIWNLPACTVYVRPERYTYEFMENQEYFTVSVPALADHDRMKVFGTRSGRDTDKLAEAGMTLAYTDSGVPYIAGSEWVLVCRKLYAQDLQPEHLTDDRPERFYQGEGWHRMYIGEVVEAYAR